MKSIILCAVLLAVLMLSGCAVPVQVAEQPAIAETAAEALMIAVQKTNWLVTISILGIAASAVAMFNGNKNAIPIAVGCFVSLILALMVARFAFVLALSGLAVSVVLVGYTVYIKNRAMKEIVGGVQLFKEGDGGAAHDLRAYLHVQSPSTKTIVREVREKL